MTNAVFTNQPLNLKLSLLTFLNKKANLILILINLSLILQSHCREGLPPGREEVSKHGKERVARTCLSVEQGGSGAESGWLGGKRSVSTRWAGGTVSHTSLCRRVLIVPWTKDGVFRQTEAGQLKINKYIYKKYKKEIKSETQHLGQQECPDGETGTRRVPVPGRLQQSLIPHS